MADDQTVFQKSIGEYVTRPENTVAEQMLAMKSNGKDKVPQRKTSVEAQEAFL